MTYVADNNLLKVSVLYVEDDRQTLEKVSGILQRRVESLSVASDGREGLELFKRRMPDMVITDIRMPVMDGLEMATRIKALNSAVPIILTTAHNDEEYLLKSIDIGIDKYIKKPLDCNLLMDALRKTTRDIHHQKEMEARNEFIRTILEKSPGFVMITDCEQIHYLNSSFLTYLGCGSVEEFNAVYGNIDKFLLEKKGMFYSGKQFSQWIMSVVRNPRKEFIVYMVCNDRSKNNAGTYLVRADRIPQNSLYLVSFSEITRIERERRLYREQAIKDPLTKVFNRKKLLEEMQKEMARAVRYDKNLSVVMFDIDHFKNINDAHGHIAGDYVLQEITRIAAKNIRESDTLARYGGEEFVILMPETDSDGARSLAMKLKDKIGRYNFKCKERITCSFGVSGYIKNDGTDDFIGRADAAMYTAKNNGRNRVELCIEGCE